VFAYSMILTSRTDDMVEIEHWFRERAQIEERLKDSKYGAALRHLPSGYKVVNIVWMWAALLAMNISATLSALARPDTSEQNAEDTEDDPCTAHAVSDPSTPPAPRGARRRREPLRAHGKRLGRETICVVGRIARHARGLVVHLHPMHEGGAMLRAYTALREMPSYLGP